MAVELGFRRSIDLRSESNLRAAAPNIRGSGLRWATGAEHSDPASRHTSRRSRSSSRTATALAVRTPAVGSRHVRMAGGTRRQSSQFRVEFFSSNGSIGICRPNASSGDRECGEDQNLDRRLGLGPSRHRQIAARPGRLALHIAADLGHKGLNNRGENSHQPTRRAPSSSIITARAGSPGGICAAVTADS